MIPKRIWFLWLQGIEKAPPLVRTCLDSWRYWNTDWHIELLDWPRLETLLPDIRRIAHPWSRMHAAALSDLVRVNLLHQYGGVWTDATCLCRTPLDAWLPERTKNGFFAFAKPAQDRLVASWFLAAEPATTLVTHWRAKANRYWDQRYERVLVDIPELLESPRFAAQRTNRMLWFDETHADFSTHYPYFWFHYLFEQLMQIPACAAQWQAVPEFSADIPHRLQQIGLDLPISNGYAQEFHKRIAPLFKLTHKGHLHAPGRGTLLEYCLDSANW